LDKRWQVSENENRKYPFVEKASFTDNSHVPDVRYFGTYPRNFNSTDPLAPIDRRIGGVRKIHFSGRAENFADHTFHPSTTKFISRRGTILSSFGIPWDRCCENRPDPIDRGIGGAVGEKVHVTSRDEA
jgi:hypothetical protein